MQKGVFVLILWCVLAGCGEDFGELELRDLYNPGSAAQAATLTDANLLRVMAQARLQQPKIRFYLHKTFTKPQAVAEGYLARGMRIRDNPPIYPTQTVDWAANPQKDLNWLFQKNATYVLAPFIQAHSQASNDSYLAIVRMVMLDWIDFNLTQNRANPLKWDDMATGLRAVNLAYLVDVELRGENLDIASLTPMLRAIVVHAAELAAPEKLAKGNHAYFQLVGLMALCKAVPELDKCPQYVEYATMEMDKLIARQFSPEGIHREHAPDYHFFSLARADAILATQWFEISADSKAWLEKAHENSVWFRHPDGTVSMIGDSARGKPKRDTFRSVMKNEVANTYGRVFPLSGYAMLRSPWHERPPNEHSYLIFWVGEESAGEQERHSYGHSHEDNFTFEWSEMGIPVLIDSGKFSYEQDEWRRYFVSTRAHNTVEIDNSDYANRNLSDNVQAIVSASSGEPLQHVHAFVEHQKSGVRHRRLLVLNPGRWLVVLDTMNDTETHHFTQWFHFHEDWRVEARAGVLLARHPRGALRVQNLSPQKSVVTNLRGATEPRIQGWVSPAYLEKVPNAAIGFSAHGEQVKLLTLFVWGEQTEPVKVKRLTLSADQTELCWGDGQRTEGFCFRLANLSRQ